MTMTMTTTGAAGKIGLAWAPVANSPCNCWSAEIRRSLADIYASEDTGRKVERAMRRGLIVHCYPGGYDTVSFTCEGARTPPEPTTPPRRPHDSASTHDPARAHDPAHDPAPDSAHDSARDYTVASS